jgi:hypothetical protein
MVIQFRASLLVHSVQFRTDDYEGSKSCIVDGIHDASGILWEPTFASLALEWLARLLLAVRRAKVSPESHSQISISAQVVNYSCKTTLRREVLI